MEDAPPANSAANHAPSPAAPPDPEWKAALKAQLGAWIDSLPEPPPELSDADAGGSAPEPGLPQFWEALVALEAHTRTHARKTVTALENFSSELRTLRTETASQRQNAPAPLVSVQGMAEINAQLGRMNAILAQPPGPAPLGLSRRWESAWHSITEGARILQRSLEAVLAQQGIRLESPEPGAPFNPTHMEAVEVLSDPERTGTGDAVGTVHESLEPAYFHNSRLLRPAKVRVIRRRT